MVHALVNAELPPELMSISCAPSPDQPIARCRVLCSWLLLSTARLSSQLPSLPAYCACLSALLISVAARVSACHSLRRSQAACTFQLHAFVAQAFAFVLSCSCAPCAATLTRVELKELRARPRQPLRSRAGAADTAPYPIATPPQAQALAISSGSCSATPTASGSRHGRG
jgi:hypothetical protein